MSTLHVTNSFNVEATVNKWFSDQINAITKPSWLTSFTVVFNKPEVEIPAQSVAVYHRSLGLRPEYQGPGMRAESLMMIYCTVARGNNPNWNAMLSTLGAMVQQVFADTPTLRLKDYAAPSAPVDANYKVNFNRVEAVDPMYISNPDYEQRQYNVRYFWDMKAS